MLKHSVQRSVPYAQRHVFDVVADIEAYPSFLPWCKGARIVERASGADEDVLLADLMVAFGNFRETFRSRVFLRPEYGAGRSLVRTEAVSGPVKHLDMRCLVIGQESGSLVEFDIAFQFRSVLLQMAAGAAMSYVAEKLVDKFEERVASRNGDEPTI